MTRANFLGGGQIQQRRKRVSSSYRKSFSLNDSDVEIWLFLGKLNLDKSETIIFFVKMKNTHNANFCPNQNGTCSLDLQRTQYITY